MPFLDRYPAFKKVFANQYQAILLGGAAAFSALTLSPLLLLHRAYILEALRQGG